MSDCIAAAPVSYWTPQSSSPPPRLWEKAANGFYLMFFPLSHFPILGVVCQRHSSLRRRKCSSTPQRRLVLTIDDDVDQGDGLHEWKFIYSSLFRVCVGLCVKRLTAFSLGYRDKLPHITTLWCFLVNHNCKKVFEFPKRQHNVCNPVGSLHIVTFF